MVRTLLHRIAAPGAFAPKAVLVVAALAMAAILALDLLTDADIRLHVLYVFPLAAIALHCEDKFDVLVGLVLSLICQLFTFSVEGTPLRPLVADALVFFASSLLVVFLARAVRENILEQASGTTEPPADGASKPSKRRVRRKN